MSAPADSPGTSDTARTSARRATSSPRPLVGPDSLIGRHPLVSFFALAYVIAWAGVPFGSFGAYAPLVAVIIVATVGDPRGGLLEVARRVFRWRVGWQWYAAAVAFPVGVYTLSILTNVGMGAPRPSLDQFSPWYAVLMVFATNLINPLGGQLGEEPGWRGFAQARMQVGRSRFAATSIMAELITVWHVPLMLPQWGLRPIELLSTVAVTFWYSWLFNRSGGSALLTLISHAVEGSLETSTLWTGADTTRMITIWAVVATAVAVVLVVVDRSFWWSSADREPSGHPRSATGRRADAQTAA